MQHQTAKPGLNQGSQPPQNTVDLPGMHVQASLGPDQVIRPLDLRFHGPLGLEALLDLLD
jgi:hypothetical protein